MTKTAHAFFIEPTKFLKLIKLSPLVLVWNFDFWSLLFVCYLCFVFCYFFLFIME
ncbi:hypothetical protein D1AOALGA4SA_12346 [Olavius algarvensis Delta 1 endosymbiont]|nr:hypothetical protein D1AOALGA4SA_12346 [Olavius algarvensis Delta 1 endosymbiont]